MSDDDKRDTLVAPNQNGSVWPRQCCPVFAPRRSNNVVVRECWYCQHADFHLGMSRALEVGVCCWPKIVIR